MPRVLFSTRHTPWPYARQIMPSDPLFSGWSFVMNQDAPEADYLVVFDEPHASIHTDIPKANRMLFIGEPPNVRTYSPDYLNLFGIVICPYDLKGYVGKQIRSHTALPWHFGVNRDLTDLSFSLTASQIEELQCPEKLNKISVVCSDKAFTAEHKARLEFLRRLKLDIPEQLDVFGRGFKPIGDKSEAIMPYKYHLVLENNRIQGFWTEKLADAFLGYALPLFSGCPDLMSYFPARSFVPLDISDYDAALAVIRSCLAGDEYASRFEQIRAARRKILYDYNMFVFAVRALSAVPRAQRLRDRQVLRTSERCRMLWLKDSVPYRRLRDCYEHGAFVNVVKDRFRNFLLYCQLIRESRNPWLDFDWGDRLGAVKRQEGFASQRGQDWYVSTKIFPNKKDGFFVDVGANHPYDLSNSYYFERLGWTGIAFEPQQHVRELWPARRSTPCYPYVIGDVEEEVEFVEVHSDGWQHALAGVKGVASASVPNLHGQRTNIVALRQRRLDNVLLEIGKSEVDVLFVDVEGYECNVLKGIDFRNISIRCIVLENDRTALGDNGLRRFLAKEGYRLVARLSGDDVFVLGAK
uniref:Methyltransferase FkbM family n=1 Tax=Nitratidesulfovibrio vulgaris (strain DSM 19637 / Miyazaki F) TaxID=883 RepID=B8DIX6_NITV9